MTYPSLPGKRSEEKGWERWLRTLMLVLAPTMLVVLYSWLLFSVQETFRTFEHRLTVLEEHSKASGGEVVDRGGFKWTSSRGYDFTPDGEVRLALDIEILSEQFRWKCGSSTEADWGDRPADLAAIIRGYSGDKELRDAKGIIAVGTASTEGMEKGQEELARNRVETLINLLQANIRRPELPTYGYWLGQFAEGEHRKECTPETANQRRIVLLKIVSLQKDLEPQEIGRSVSQILLQKVTTEGIVFPIDIRKYSRFQRQEELLVWGRNLPEHDATR